jgi:hypothetical protein
MGAGRVLIQTRCPGTSLLAYEKHIASLAASGMYVQLWPSQRPRVNGALAGMLLRLDEKGPAMQVMAGGTLCRMKRQPCRRNLPDIKIACY